MRRRDFSAGENVYNGGRGGGFSSEEQEDDEDDEDFDQGVQVEVEPSASSTEGYEVTVGRSGQRTRNPVGSGSGTARKARR